MRLLLIAILLMQTQQPPLHGHVPPPALPRQRFLDDMRTKNLEDVLALYTADAQFIQPDGTILNTPAARRKLYEQVFAAYDSDIKLSVGTLSGNGRPDQPGSVWTQAGTYSEVLRTHATNITQQLCGGFSFTWRSQPDMRWLLTRMAWTSTPCPATPIK